MAQLRERPIAVEQFLARFQRHEFHSAYGTVSYVDDGPEHSPMTLVFLHGNPTWSFLYRHLLERFVGAYRVIAPDLIGFGMSDKPAGLVAYSVTAQSQILHELVEAAGLGKVVLVGQDWGGPLATLLAASLGDRCAGLVLMNTYLPGMNILNQFGRQAMKSHLGRRAIIYLDLFRQAAFLCGFRKPITSSVRQAYRFPHQKRSQRLGVWAFPAQIPDSKHQTPQQQQLMATIDSYLLESAIPKLLLYADSDPLFPLSQVRLLWPALNNASYHEIVGAGHFIQEDQPGLLADLIEPWLLGLVTKVD